MDPINVIETALVAGAAASAKDTASQALKDTYSGLRTLLMRVFIGRAKAQEILVDHEAVPETYEKPLKKALTEAHIEQYQEVLDAAHHLLTLVQPQQAGMGKYNVQITGNVQGVAQGDHQQVTMHFGEASREQ